MTDPMIATRRSRGEAALESYYRTTGCGNHALDEALIDLLTDLRHWSHDVGIDFGRALDHSSFHFETEVAS